MQSIASRLAAIFLCARMVSSPPMEGRFAQLASRLSFYCVTHGELSHACLCPVYKGIDSRFSCLAVFVLCHNSDDLSLLKKFDAYPNGDFNKDDSLTYKSQTEHPGIGMTVEVCTFLDIADSFELLLLVSEQVDENGAYPPTKSGSIHPFVSRKSA